MKKGFIKIPNRFFGTKWWSKRRTYSEAEAFLDLCLIYSREGNLNFSVRVLAQRWLWPKSNVSRFLSAIQDEGFIDVSKDDEKTNVGTQSGTSSGTPKPLVDSTLNEVGGTLNGTANGTLNETASRTYLNDNINLSMSNTLNEVKEEDIIKKKEVEEKETNKRTATVVATNLEGRKREFYDSLVPYVEKYGRDMVRDFYDFWSEENRSHTKMRFELQKTWEVGRRLGYWYRRSSNGTSTYNRTGYSHEQQRRNDSLQRMQEYASVAAGFREQALADLALREKK